MLLLFVLFAIRLAKNEEIFEEFGDPIQDQIIFVGVPADEEIFEEFENYTPHEIVVRLDGEGSITFHSLGVARVTEQQTILTTYGGIEIRKTTYGSIVGLPELKCGVKYIVSMVVLNANAKAEEPRTDLVGPDSGKSCIRDASGKIIAVTGFSI
jgi:hypothetical protein